MSLDLDDRQRAMLKEMGVRVWWPKTVPQAPAAPDLQVDKIALKNNLNNIIDDKNTKTTINSISNNAIDLTAYISKIQTENKEYTYNKDGTRAHAPAHAQVHADIHTQSWPVLAQTVAACRACQLCEGRTQAVFGVGTPVAPSVHPSVGLPVGLAAGPLGSGTSPGSESAPQVDWLIVGEAPGENEDRVGEPFVGQAGQLLDNMLKAMKLSRRSGAGGGVYIANVIKCRPPGNRNPTPAEVAQCEPYLHRQIALLQPKMILAMGKFAATSLLRASVPEVDKTPLGKLRGQVHAYSHEGLTIPVVATYHPAYLLRSLTEKAKAWEDLCLALNSLAAMAAMTATTAAMTK